MIKHLSKIFSVIPGVKPGMGMTKRIRGVTRKQFQKGFLKLTKKALTTYLIVSTVIVSTGLIYLFNPFTVKETAAWFNEAEPLIRSRASLIESHNEDWGYI